MDTLSFGSFPRSGCHFCYELINQALPKTRLIYLEHRIHPLDKQENVFVTIRNPLECIPSWIVLMDDKRVNRAEQALEWYFSYYQKCKESNVLIIPFEKLISEPLVCVNRVCEKYGLEKPTIDTIEFDFSTGFHSPTKDKSEYSVIIDEIEIAPSFSRAIELFRNITDLEW